MVNDTVGQLLCDCVTEFVDEVVEVTLPDTQVVKLAETVGDIVTEPQLVLDKVSERVPVGQCDCVVVTIGLLVAELLTLLEGERETVAELVCVELPVKLTEPVKDTVAV